MISLNPFHQFKKSNKILNNVESIFTVFVGNYFDSYTEEENHLGIFDYMTCGISYGLFYLFDLAEKKESNTLFVLTGVIFSPFILINYVFSSLLTLALSPFIALATAFVSTEPTNNLPVNSLQCPLNRNCSEKILLNTPQQQEKKSSLVDENEIDLSKEYCRRQTV